MDLRKILDAVTLVLQILDAKYPKAFCKGTKDGGSSEKQLIPSRYHAIKYATNADPALYKAYLEHRPKVKHPHYTGVYYCPWCDAWHVTTSPIENPDEFESRWRGETVKALAQRNECLLAPKEGQSYTKVLHFPDYSDEELEQYFKRFK